MSQTSLPKQNTYYDVDISLFVCLFARSFLLSCGCLFACLFKYGLESIIRERIRKIFFISFPWVFSQLWIARASCAAIKSTENSTLITKHQLRFLNELIVVMLQIDLAGLIKSNAIVLLAVGGFLFILGFLGVCGACKKNATLLKIVRAAVVLSYVHS